jgi:hypothetical protein
MGRTMPSFRIALAMEKRKSGNHFALLEIRKKEKKILTICLILLNSTSLLLAPIPVSLYHFILSIVMSILYHHYKELKEYVSNRLSR